MILNKGNILSTECILSAKVDFPLSSKRPILIVLSSRQFNFPQTTTITSVGILFLDYKTFFLKKKKKEKEKEREARRKRKIGL